MCIENACEETVDGAAAAADIIKPTKPPTSIAQHSQCKQEPAHHLHVQVMCKACVYVRSIIAKRMPRIQYMRIAQSVGQARGARALTLLLLLRCHPSHSAAAATYTHAHTHIHTSAGPSAVSQPPPSRQPRQWPGALGLAGAIGRQSPSITCDASSYITAWR